MVDRPSVDESCNEDIQIFVNDTEANHYDVRNVVITDLSQSSEDQKTNEESGSFLKVDDDTSLVHVRESPDIFDNVRDTDSVSSSRVSVDTGDTSSTSHEELTDTPNKNIDLSQISHQDRVIVNNKPSKTKVRERSRLKGQTNAKVNQSFLADKEPHQNKKSKSNRSRASSISDSPRTTRNIGVYIHQHQDNDDFLNDSYLETVFGDIGEVWCEVFVLMGVPFATIESVLAETDTQTKLHDVLLRIFFDWRDKQSKRDDRGVPMLLAALRKGGRWIESIGVQKALKLWRERPATPADHPLCRWLERAYKDLDIYIPGEYPRPLSDQFYAMLAPRMQAIPALASALTLSMAELEVVRQKDKYVNETMACMKTLIMLQAKGGSDVAVLDSILNALDKVGFLDARNTAIATLKGWLKRTAKDDDVMLLPVKQLLSKHLPSDHRQSAYSHREFSFHTRRLNQRTVLKIFQSRTEAERHDY